MRRRLLPVTGLAVWAVLAACSHGTASRPPPSTEQLQAVLLTAEDLPSGYALNNSVSSPGSDAATDDRVVNPPSCTPLLLDTLPISTPTPVAGVLASFDGAVSGAGLAEHISSFPDPATSAAVVQARTTVLSDCSRFTMRHRRHRRIRIRDRNTAVPAAG